MLLLNREPRTDRLWVRIVFGYVSSLYSSMILYLLVMLSNGPELTCLAACTVCLLLT